MDDLAEDTMRSTGKRPALSGAERALARLREQVPALADAELDHFGEGTRGSEALRDAVSDLLHLAYRNGIHPDALYRRAANDWHAETGDEEAALYAENAENDDEDDEDDEDAPFVQTTCRHCELDIEGQQGDDEWRDRGNNARCNDGRNAHAPN